MLRRLGWPLAVLAVAGAIAAALVLAARRAGTSARGAPPAASPDPSAEALRTLEAEARAGRGGPALHLALGQGYLARGEAEKALAALAEAARHPRTAGAAGLALADLAARFELRAAVVPALRDAVRAAPRDARTWEALVRVLHELGETRAADAVLTEGLRRLPRASRLRFLRAELLAARGKGVSAVRAYEAALRDDPDPEAQLALALLLGRLNADQQAKKAFERAIELDPASLPARIGLAKIDLALGLAAEAEAAAYAALQIGPEDPEAIYTLARVLSDRPEAESQRTASELLERVLALDPNHVEARYRLGLLKLRRQDPRGAAREFQHVLERHPDRLDARQSYARALRAMGDRRAAAEQEAIATHLLQIEQRRYQLAARVSQKPADPAARCDLADFYLEHDAVPKAIEQYRRALELDPSNRRAAEGLARARQRLR